MTNILIFSTIGQLKLVGAIAAFDQINFMPSLKDIAIQHALDSNWNEAIAINQELLKDSPRDIDSLNRLAYAFMQSNNFDDANKTYEYVISLDKTNPIAIKNIRKLQALSTQTANGKNLPSKHLNHIDNVFIQEAGKTKTVELTNIADRKKLISLQNGDDVTLTVKRSKIFVLTSDKTFIGMLPDSLGVRLISFIKGGNEYQACIKSIDEKALSVFIKETKRAKKFINVSSFS